MDRITAIADMRAWSRRQAVAGHRIAFVPTMGALHEGHIALVRMARQEVGSDGAVVASVFVNPTQFDRAEDLEKYPRTLEEDCRMLQAAGCDAVFHPEASTMYRDGHATFVEIVGPLTDKMCAVARPGHFRGVATVVTKLFCIVRPDIAVFGQKDLQQAMIIARMTGDLDLGVEIRIHPTLRDPDGLAMSSRNRRLTPAMRAKALALPRGLELARRAFASGERDAAKLCAVLAEEVLVHDGTDLDYAEVVGLPGFAEQEHADERSVLAAAIFVDGVRLIDHIALNGGAMPVAVE